MKWYKLYLEAQIRGVISTAYAYTGPMRLRAFVVLALARRDAAAELKRLSAVSSAATVTIKQADYKQAITLIKALRELAQDAVVPLLRGAGATVE